VKTIPIKNKEPKVLKRKQNHQGNEVFGSFLGSDYSNNTNSNSNNYYNNNNQGFKKILDEDTSNRSSSGSAISNSESCVQLGSADPCEFTDPVQSNVWDTMVPSRKRTCVSRSKPSSVEKLTKDLCTILHEHQSYFSSSSDEDLLFDTDHKPMESVEFGSGSVLIRNPNSVTSKEEESEASSLSFDNNNRRQHFYPTNEAYSRFNNTLNVNNNNNIKGVKFPSMAIEKNKKIIEQGFDQEPIRRDKSQHELLQLLGVRNSPLCYIDLQDVVNFEEFKNHMASDEQQQLLKYVPCNKDGSPLHSFESMFESPEFKENLVSFQKLLEEGMFDPSLSEAKSDGIKNLKSLALCNSTKSKWVEQYHLLKDLKGKNIIAGPQEINKKRLPNSQYQSLSGPKTALKSPKRGSNYENKEVAENEGNCFSAKSLFALPPDSTMLMLESFQFTNENSDQDLLLNVPSNSSFPQAELLLPARASTSSTSIYRNLVHH
jgi:hypothetical protein